MNAFTAKINALDKKIQCRGNLKILQVNVGDLCNQSCKHCHVNAGPQGRNIMKKETIDEILDFLRRSKDLMLDITGGAPEMNPNFEYFVSSARPLVKDLIVRTNLTVFFEPGKEGVPEFHKKNKVHIVCSLPCYSEENVDSQRGKGVFKKSIKALKILNGLGYGSDPNLKLDLVYNPGGAFLPAPQEDLEEAYREKLKAGEGIGFNSLMTIINAPIVRFKDQLEAEDQYEEYMELLADNFNENVAGNIMCRTLLNVGWDGTLYDCDFNQAVDMPLEDGKEKKLKIKDISPDDLIGRNVLFADHCFSCTAGSGSSCQGALKKK